MEAGDFPGLRPMERGQGPEIDETGYGSKEIAMRQSSIAVQFRHNAKLFQITNDMLHQNTGFVDDMIEQLIKQSDRMISGSAFRLADFVMRKAMFSTFITAIQVDLHVFRNRIHNSGARQQGQIVHTARDIAGNMQD